MPRSPLALLALLACSEYQVNEQHPRMVLPIDTLDFEQVVRGTRVTLTVSVENAGRAPLLIDAARLTEATSADFAIVDLEADEIAAGEGAALSVSYTPDAVGQDLGELELETNDPEQPTRRLGLIGYGVEPRIDVDPETLWFGDVTPPAERTLTVDLAARGQGWLSVRDVVLDGDTAPFTYALPSSVSLPHRMSPGAGFSIDVTYKPTDTLEARAELLIHSNDPLEPVVAVRLLGNVEGEGIEPPSVEITDPDWGNYLLAGETASLRGVVVDDADPPENLLCAWYANGLLLGTSTPDSAGNVALDTDTLPVGEVTLALRALDSAGNAAEDEVDVVVWDPEEPIRYVISGGSSIFDYWTVDDDVTVLLDGEPVLQDTNRTQDTHAPVEFEARAGQQIRILATDINACQKKLSPLTLHFGTSDQQQLNDLVCGSSCPQDACYDGSYAGPWPNVFLDETWTIEIP
ncbi:MAG: choice-of-anchor D domain-containing protein [Alphaproteobacteria bacterium]|nr:choice-of-anchor D domain-containing protein [Alphaproteobacteria bacterium]